MADRLQGFTEEEYEKNVSEQNRELVDDFLQQQKHLSSQTIKQYRSALMIFLKWNYENNRNKNIPDLKPRDGLKFQNFLIDSGLSTSGIKIKRSTVSSLYNYLEVFWADEYPNVRNIFNKAVPTVGNVRKKEKIPLTVDEINALVDLLVEKEEWQKLAYLAFTYSTGCRREESRQLLKEVVNYEKYIDKKGSQKNYYVTHDIRAKGKGNAGKVRKFQFDDFAMKCLKKWIEVRGEDDCEFMFVVKDKNGVARQVAPNTFNEWCEHFSELIGKKVHPHLLRSSFATNMALNGKNIAAIQKMLGHNSAETTQIYIVRDESEDIDEIFE